MDTDSLVAAATRLNKASNDLNATITQIQQLIGKLNIGLQCWIRIPDYKYEEKEVKLGYTRTAVGQWMLAAECGEQQWPLTSAPRTVRIAAVAWIPDLLDAMVKTADATTNRLNRATVDAEEMVAAIQAAVAMERDTDANNLNT